MVPSEGVEPPCLAALGSKPSVSANSTNWAQTRNREQYLYYSTGPLAKIFISCLFFKHKKSIKVLNPSASVIVAPS